MISSLSPTMLKRIYSHVSLSVWLEFLQSRTASLSLSLSLSLTTPTNTLPSIQPLATNLLADTTLLRHTTAHTTVYKVRIGATDIYDLWAIFCLLGPWPLKKGPIGCPETSVRSDHSWLRNNPEDRTTQLLRGGSLKSLQTQTLCPCGLSCSFVGAGLNTSE
jgi:hypothetical protein